MSANTKLLIAAGLLFAVFGAWLYLETQPAVTSSVTNGSVLVELSAEETARSFVESVLLTAPPVTDQTALQRALEFLSPELRATIDEEQAGRDLALLLGVQDVPDLGTAVIDMIEIPDETIVTIALYYSGGPTARDITLRQNDDGQWLVSAVTPGVTPSDEVEPSPGQVNDGDAEVTDQACFTGGCSRQLCGDRRILEVMTTCEWREEYACYQTAVCERQADRECGWTMTDQLVACLATAGTPSEY